VIEFRIKEKTRSLNESFRGDWRPRAAVAKRQRRKAMQACPKWPGGPLLCVRLTRVSPGTLDSDALPAALKHVRDGVADRLKIDDASPLVEWEYHQAKGEAEVVVQIWRWNAEGDAPSLPMGRPVERRRGKALAKVAADAGKRLRVVREPGNGQKRVPRRKDAPTEALAFARALNAQPNYTKPQRIRAPLLPRPLPEAHSEDAARSVEFQRRLGAKAAREAEETFAPAPVAPCNHCGEEYRAKCYDPKASPGSAKCRKDVHCYRYDGHDGDCAARARSCTT